MISMYNAKRENNVLMKKKKKKKKKMNYFKEKIKRKR